MVALSCQWDAALQKMAPLLKNLAKSAKSSRRQVGGQVMVISGHMHRWRVGIASRLGDPAAAATGGDGEPQKPVPWHRRALRLEGQDTNYLLEALLRSLPVDLRDVGLINRVMTNCKVFVLVVTIDRAKHNLLSCKWLCGWVASFLRQPRIIFHPELCALHGLALVKCKAAPMKNGVAG